MSIFETPQDLRGRLRAFHDDEEGMEALQVVMIVAISAVVLILLKTFFTEIKTWAKGVLGSMIGAGVRAKVPVNPGPVRRPEAGAAGAVPGTRSPDRPPRERWPMSLPGPGPIAPGLGRRHAWFIASVAPLCLGPVWVRALGGVSQSRALGPGRGWC